jgi:hypothetical protein
MIPKMSQKSVTITLPAEVTYLNFFGECRPIFCCCREVLRFHVADLLSENSSTFSNVTFLYQTMLQICFSRNFPTSFLVHVQLFRHPLESFWTICFHEGFFSSIRYWTWRIFLSVTVFDVTQFLQSWKMYFLFFKNAHFSNTLNPGNVIL